MAVSRSVCRDALLAIATEARHGTDYTKKREGPRRLAMEAETATYVDTVVAALPDNGWVKVRAHLRHYPHPAGPGISRRPGQIGMAVTGRTPIDSGATADAQQVPVVLLRTPFR